MTKMLSKFVHPWLQEYWGSYNLPNKVGVFVILALALVAPVFGGWDFYSAYRAETLTGDYIYSFNPYPAYWFFYPFTILPPTMGYIMWNLLNAAGFLYALYYWKSDPLPFSISIVCLWNFFGGQIEGFLAGAIALAFNTNFLIAGSAIYILTFKPQIGLIAILFIVLQKRDWRQFIIPIAIYLVSFIHLGWWVPEWLAHLRTGYDIIGIGYSNISLYPIGFVFALLILRYKKSLKIWMLSTSLVVPYFPVYSLASFFTMETSPWWIQVAIWLFYLAPSMFNVSEKILDYPYIIPLTLLGMEIWKLEKYKIAAIS